MPALANPQHEAFAQNIVAGCSLTESAKRAGHPVGAANFGSRLIEHPQIAQRIIELQALQNPQPIPANDSNAPHASRSVETYTDKAWVVTELVAIERLARKLKDVSGMHACVKTLAQIGGHLEPRGGGAISPRDPATLALLGISEIHSMLKQVVGSAPAADRRKLLAEAPELAEIVAEVEAVNVSELGSTESGDNQADS